MTHKKSIFLIVITVVLCSSLLVGTLTISANAKSCWTEKQEKAHEIAEIARSMGLSEDDVIITRAQEIWWEEENSKTMYLGKFRCYAYCPCTRCCGSNASGITATGTTATEGRTIAVDPKVIPLGSKVVINGKTYIAEDTGGGIKGNKIDVFFNTHDEALQWGVQYCEVSICD